MREKEDADSKHSLALLQLLPEYANLTTEDVRELFFMQSRSHVWMTWKEQELAYS